MIRIDIHIASGTPDKEAIKSLTDFFKGLESKLYLLEQPTKKWDLYSHPLTDPIQKIGTVIFKRRQQWTE